MSPSRWYLQSADTLIWAYGQEVAEIVVAAIANYDAPLYGAQEMYGISQCYGVPFVLNLGTSMDDPQVAGDPERHWQIVDHGPSVGPLDSVACRQSEEGETLSSIQR